MIDNPLVSIVTPVFNGEKYINETINSILLQTYKNIEIIVVDNCSTDKTPDICKSFGKKVKYFKNKENYGIGYNRWRGVRLSKGDYIVFCSADDVIFPNYIEEMLKASEEHPNNIIYCNYNFVNENGNLIREFKDVTYDNEEEWIMSVIFNAKANTMSVCYNIFSPSNILKENNFDKKIWYGEDLEHLLRCVLVKKIKYFHLAKTLFNYRTHLQATTTTENKNIPENNRKIFNKINKMMKRKIL